MLSFAVSNVKTAAVINDASIATSSPVGQASVNARGEDCARATTVMCVRTDISFHTEAILHHGITERSLA